ncbi:hypothetical protein PRIPAC_92440 [Pristionchus pacificus]|nr:hypothetical protein PRIPAC_92440 [Pristionchus pacificus]|eukprot:PDM68101.1 G protein-coupled receptor [Pristionchus pacificus]
MNSSSPPPLCSTSTSTDLELFIEFSIAIPSMVLYILFFIVYFKSFQLRSSYYLLFFVHSCINIVYFISRALLMRVTSFSLLCQWILDNFGELEYTFTPLYFIYHYTQHAQALSIMAININRVFAIYFYNSFTVLHYLTYVLLFSTLLLPLPLTWHLLISPVKYIPSPPVLAMDYHRTISYPGLSVLHLIVDTAATGVVAGTSVLILAQMQSLQKRRKTNERSLIIVSLLLSFGLLLSATVQYLIHSLPRQSSGYFFTLNHRWIITDFVSLFPPWSLLLLSSVVRTEISSLLRLSSPSSLPSSNRPLVSPPSISIHRVVTLQGVTPHRGSTIGEAALPTRKTVTLPLGVGNKDRGRMSRWRGSIPHSTPPSNQHQYHLIPTDQTNSNNITIEIESISTPRPTLR